MKKLKYKSLNDYSTPEGVISLNVSSFLTIPLAVILSQAAWIGYIPLVIVLFSIVYYNFIHPHVWLYYENKKVKLEAELRHKENLEQILLSEKLEKVEIPEEIKLNNKK